MTTDWNLVRQVLNTVIDSCERLEQAGYREEHRGLTITVGEHRVSVHELLISAWTVSKNTRYHVIRERHDKAQDLPYVPETARILTAAATACAELVAGGPNPPVSQAMHGLVKWFRQHFDPNIQKPIASASSENP